MQKIKDVTDVCEIGADMLPYTERYFKELILTDVIRDPHMPVVVNLNVGHAAPRCIIPFGRHAKVSVSAQEIVFEH